MSIDRNPDIPDRFLVAIGGNATHPLGIMGTPEEQGAIAHATGRALLPLMELNNELVITHGNGLWSKNLSPFLEGLARGEFQLTSFKIAMIKERPPKMNNPAVSNSFSPSGASDFTPLPGGNT